jgi:hypothetical protein
MRSSSSSADGCRGTGDAWPAGQIVRLTSVGGTRHPDVAQATRALGVILDPASSRQAVAGKTAFVHGPESRTATLVLPMDQERVILDEVVAQLPV